MTGLNSLVSWEDGADTETAHTLDCSAVIVPQNTMNDITELWSDKLLSSIVRRLKSEDVFFVTN